MFVVTEELKEFIEEMQKLRRMFRNPKYVLGAVATGVVLTGIYFMCVAVADIITGAI